MAASPDSHAPRDNEQTKKPGSNVAARDYYEVLGVPRNATPDEINSAYRKAALRTHPDRHVNESQAEQEKLAEEFKDLSAAHAVLSNPEKRSMYDLYGPDAFQSRGEAADDAASAAMFEEMMGMGAAQKKRVVGGALFVERGMFRQREWDVDDVPKMRDEMLQGLPDVVSMASQSPSEASEAHVMTTSLPHGAWDVRLVDADAGTRAVTITLWADETATKEADEATSVAPLRCERSFFLPADADVAAVDAEVDDSGTLKVTVPLLGREMRCVDSPACDVTTSARVDVDTHAPFHVGVDESTVAGPGVAQAPMQANRAVRRRAKQEGLKSGFLSKTKRNKAARKENEPKPAPSIARRHSSPSPVSVREVV